jgi:hypothetical protein
MTETATRMTGKWSEPGVPHKGWDCVDVEDLCKQSAICEMCETQEIRYVHHMEHPLYSETLKCGCVCAGRMEEDYEGARQREKVLRNAASRKRNWLSRAWQQSGKGNPYINTDGYNIVVFQQRSSSMQAAWGFRITNRLTEAVALSGTPYSSANAAKLAAFDAMIRMKAGSR